MKKLSDFSIYILLILAVILSAVETVLNLQEKELSSSTQAIWNSIFFLMTIVWAYYDSERKDFNRPFDFGFFIYIFWPVSLPWYLIKTRGIEGLLVFLGFIMLWLAPLLSGLIAYVYY